MTMICPTTSFRSFLENFCYLQPASCFSWRLFVPYSWLLSLILVTEKRVLARTCSSVLRFQKRIKKKNTLI